MEPILVTGGTGTLGRQLVDQLAARGRTVRVLSRRPRPGRTAEGVEWFTGDLLTGEGLDPALADGAVVIHCASNPARPRQDIETTGRLTEAARRAGTPHLLHVSIVGIDLVPMPYYRAKLRAEGIVADSGVPFTIQRATQFHELIRTVAQKLTRGPVGLAPGVVTQPVAAGEVAERLAVLAERGPAGRVPDLGGPETGTLAEFFRATLEAEGRRRPLLPLRIPGRFGRALRQGHLTTREPDTGHLTFREFLAASGSGR
ncbi:SDR family oxidoreductase [Streptomyces orinoci]|uniref:NAD(P)H-binding protein n=1 Tax=Streptomyces orinoci TaxID=67339 RepID=A0ABV3K3W2_STRON|nr:NAD(P)H-binding protein [Streptomyces orinoci]